MCLHSTNNSEVTIVQSRQYYWEFLFKLKEVTYRHRNLGLEEERTKETLNIKIVGDFINSLKRVGTQNFDIRRRNYEAVNFIGFSRYDYDLELIFFKFLLVFKICFWMQHECMMSCNMSALYVPHQNKRLPNIDGVCIIGGNSHSSTWLVLMRQSYAIVVSVPTKNTIDIYSHTSSLIPQVAPTHLTLHGQRCIHHENIFISYGSDHKTFLGLHMP
jgi:hypothetical protein